jgi:mannose-6-phosphate isomerase-like protein (cupin superfamily)
MLDSIDLFAASLRIRADHSISVSSARELEDWSMAAFRAATNADVHSDHWEMHPESDEIVFVLSGRFRLILRAEASTQDEDRGVVLTRGKAAIVPRGRWHRFELDEPGELVSSGLRRGTLLEQAA